jgi:hypothetical protein
MDTLFKLAAVANYHSLFRIQVLNLWYPNIQFFLCEI